MSKTKQTLGKSNRATELVRKALAIESRNGGLVTINSGEIARRAGCSRVLVQLTIKVARGLGLGSPRADRSRAPSAKNR